MVGTKSHQAQSSCFENLLRYKARTPVYLDVRRYWDSLTLSNVYVLLPLPLI